MANKAQKKLEIQKFVEGEHILALNESLGRNIPYEELDEKVLNKRDYYKHKRNPNHMEIDLTEKVCKMPSDYMLSNIPVLCEKRSMQDYHFNYSNEQLKNMCKTPKVIIDKFCSSFVTSSGIIQRTSFYLIAPNAQQNIPQLYRLSITTSKDDEEHYNISMHAIVGGKVDGWLFLGRLDNDTVEPHKIAETEYTPKELKSHNAAKIECFSSIDRKVRENAKVSRSEKLPDIYSIPFPHMHKPDTHYKVGEDIERCLPKFMKNCVNKSFEENVAYFMERFNVYEHPHFRKANMLLSDVIKEEKKTINNTDEITAKEVMQELYVRGNLAEKVSTKELKSKPQKQKRREPKKLAYIQNKERYIS